MKKFETPSQIFSEGIGKNLKLEKGMTMKIIDILVGKETPNKFKYSAGTFERQNNGGYIDKNGDNLTEWIFSDYSNIYDEVEIITEDKKIEKLHYNIEGEFNIEGFTFDFEQKKQLVDKINEIIDYLMENNK